jgi:gamma-glutamyltranspeptidase
MVPIYSHGGQVKCIDGAGHGELDWEGNNRLVTSLHGAVASDQSRCSEMVIVKLKFGGNKKVTMALGEGLYNPMASGIDGSGFIMDRRKSLTPGILHLLAPQRTCTHVLWRSSRWL